MEQYEVVESDVLIIGGGGAGARAAIKAADEDCNVALINKGLMTRSGATPMAAATYTVPLNPQDNKQTYFMDTVRVGRRLGDQNLINALVEDAKPRLLDLVEYGVPFQKDNGEIFQEIHPGQTYPRNAYIRGGGFPMMRSLYDQIRKRSNVHVYEDHLTTRIFKVDEEVAGASILDLRKGRFLFFHSNSIILATGGCMEIFKRSTASPDVTGDGLAMAFDVGAELVDLEMIQYYPTHPVYPDYLQSSVRYETFLQDRYLNGKILNGEMKEFLPPGKLPPRDELTRLILEEIEKGKGSKHDAVYIDVREPIKKLEQLKMEAVEKQIILGQYDTFKKSGLDIKEELLEVAPAAHYTVGGVRINENCETSVAGLYAAGEVSGNIHGANRISGNAFTETQVFGFRAGKAAAERGKKLRGRLARVPKEDVLEEISRREGCLREGDEENPVKLRRDLKDIINRRLMLRRNKEGLGKAMEEVKSLKEKYKKGCTVADMRRFNYEWQQAIELGFMLDLSEIVLGSALLRQESRGHHFRSDYPETREDWVKHTLIYKRDGEVWYGTAPIARIRG